MTPGIQGRRQPNRNQRGYAYMLVMFLLALLIVSTMSAVPNVLIEGRREREQEMIWRGNQYKRAIRLFVSHRTNSNHRLPTSLEELTKGRPGVHFLRQAYKDPMNKKDGSWRLIYVGPSGQLIGSTRPQPQNLVIPGMSPTPPPPGAAPQTGSDPNGPLSMAGQSSQGITSFGSQGKPPESAESGSSSPPEVPPDGVALVGGHIIGAGSKVERRSVIWFEKAKNYRQFEFIWDPAKDAAAAVPQGGAAAGQGGGGFGQPGGGVGQQGGRFGSQGQQGAGR